MTNLLAREKSPYLLQHADNPVAWQPWGPAALAQAQAEQKPIFLSIGYSTCHWCHVMAHESFENLAVAAVLNRDFIPVKVDREERPDLDRVYMAYVQQTTGHGGWPMSVWLTPEGKPFFGGTYFPPDDRPGRAGFVTVLHAITRHWAEQREKILHGADEVVAALQRLATDGPAREIGPEGGATAPLHEAAAEAFEKCYQYFYEAHDPTWGGFGGAPKFPRASVINFLFRTAALQGAASELGAAAVQMAAHTLQKMAEGGLHDHLGGGFHRYSVDEQWFVPHFEKMLYDQAQIALNYLEAKQATGRVVFAWVARGIFDYVQRDLTGPHGGFYSAEDADSALPDELSVGAGPGALGGHALPPAGDGSSEGLARPVGKHPHAEGAFYVWTKSELDLVLGVDAEFFCAHFGVKIDGNVEHDPQAEFTGKNILRQRQSLVITAREFDVEIGAASEKLLGCLAKLRAVRVTRPRPHLDDKVITAWNGLMISALAKGHQVLECHPERSEGSSRTSGGDHADGFFADAQNDKQVERPCLLAATRAAEFIERELYDPATGVLYRSWREGRSDIAGFAEDYAYLIQGLLDLYEAGFAIRWLQWAEKLQAKMDELFWDAGPVRPAQGGPGGDKGKSLGGYFNSRADDLTVIVRLKEDYDGAEPAPNSVAALNLVRLDWMIGTVERTAPGEPPEPGSSIRLRPGYGGQGGLALPSTGDGAPGGHALPSAGNGSSGGLALPFAARARLIIEAFRPQWSRAPQALPQMLVALEMLLAEPRTVVLAGDPASADFRALASVLHPGLGPRMVILAADGADGQRWLAARRPYLAEMKPENGQSAAFVCNNFTCHAAVRTRDELLAALDWPRLGFGLASHGPVR